MKYASKRYRKTAYVVQKLKEGQIGVMRNNAGMGDYCRGYKLLKLTISWHMTYTVTVDHVHVRRHSDNL